MGNLRHYIRLQSIKVIKLVKNRFNPIVNTSADSHLIPHSQLIYNGYQHTIKNKIAEIGIFMLTLKLGIFFKLGIRPYYIIKHKQHLGYAE